MPLPRRRQLDPDAFGANVLRALGDTPPGGTPRGPVGGPIPGNPWARRLVVALAAHVPRQRWVAKIVCERLGGDLRAIARSGGFAHPAVEQGPVPGIDGWSFYFHGRGCCLTSQDGTAIDVDFDEHGAEGVDPFFYVEYLRSLPAPAGLEASLRRAKPEEEWWMAELDCLRVLGWLEGDHRVRLTPVGARWAAALRPAYEVITGEKDPAEKLRAAILVKDFPWAAQMEGASGPVRRLASRWKMLRAAQLDREVGARRKGQAFAAMAVLAPERAAGRAREVLASGPLDGLTSRALELLLAQQPGPDDSVLLTLARRASGQNPPEPYLRMRAVIAILKQYRADTVPAELRTGMLEVLGPEAHSEEGIAALAHVLLDPEQGIGRLQRCLRSQVPIARADAAAALALIGTPGATAALRRARSVPEARDALALLRGVVLEPGPEPRGTVVTYQGAPRRVYSIEEILARNRPSLVRTELARLARELGPLLERWWAH